MASYRGTLAAVGKCGAKALPQIGEGLQQSLLALQSRLTVEATPAVISDTEQRVKDELQQWSTNAFSYLNQKVGEIKEIMLFMARTVEATSERDQRYAGNLRELTVCLQAVGDLDDLTEVRRALGKSANDLRDCVDRMTRESRESVARLRTELSTYQCRLEEAEKLASLDSLTGLVNRRDVERQIAHRIGNAQEFCVILLDLNGFKQINDRYGHPAGDDILKQFSKELRSFFRSADTVGRWGGDEFLVIVDCSPKDAEVRMERLREWVFGEYPVQGIDGTRRVRVSAAAGLAAWKTGESAAELLARADAAMYRCKLEGPERER